MGLMGLSGPPVTPRIGVAHNFPRTRPRVSPRVSTVPDSFLQATRSEETSPACPRNG